MNKISLTIVCKICALAEKNIYIQIQSNPYNTHLGVFSYEKEWENGEFETLPTKFKNLKTSLKRHLNLPGHLTAIGYAKKTEEMKRKVELRTKTVGMRVQPSTAVSNHRSLRTFLIN